MRIQSIRVFICSSVAILALTLVWGFGQIPGQGDLAEDQVRVSLAQELAVVRGAVRTAVGSVTLKTLDVLKGEPEQAKRTITTSGLSAAVLADWADGQWRLTNFVTTRPDAFTAEGVRTWIADWGLDKLAPEDSYFTKVTELDGRAYFGVATRVRRGDQTAYAVGVFAANEFPMELPTDRARDISVFDSKGVALALNHSAYVGASLRRHPLASEILESDVVNVRTEWTNERRQPMLGAATRLGDSNLYAAIEARAPLSAAAARNAWIFLLLSGVGALALNWALFAGLTRPLFAALAGAEAQIENLRRVLVDAPAPPVPAAEPALAAAELPRVDFLESADEADVPPPPPPAPETPLGKVVNLALRGLEPRLRELDVLIDRVGLDDVSVTDDVLQLQTAIEELIKNSVEAMADAPGPRRLALTAHAADGRLRLTVEDSGPGVAPELVARVFEPFFTTREQASGVARGLGLNVVRRILEAMGGGVTARNRVGQPGFTCELTWPRAGRPSDNVAPPAPPAETPDQPEARDLALLADEDDDFAVAPPAARSSRPDERVRRPRVRTLE